jgi:hypothetical protein
MRKTAGFLKACCTIVLVLLVIAAMVVTGVLVMVAMAGSFSELASKTGNVITISGGSMTPAEMDALKPVMLGVMAAALVALVLAILGTLKTRDALTECKEERPFSRKCADSLKSAARFEVLGGVAGIICTVVLSFMAANLTVNGSPISSGSTTFSLSFVFNAVMKYLAYHVVNYGHSLERDPRRR